MQSVEYYSVFAACLPSPLTYHHRQAAHQVKRALSMTRCKSRPANSSRLSALVDRGEPCPTPFFVRPQTRRLSVLEDGLQVSFPLLYRIPHFGNVGVSVVNAVNLVSGLVFAGDLVDVLLSDFFADA
jgi:hypothetical protein